MASTNSFQPAEDEFPEDGDSRGKVRRRRRTANADDAGEGRVRPTVRGAADSTRVQRKASRRSQRSDRVESDNGDIVSGWPKLEGLKPVLMFLALPAILVMTITLTGGNWPSSILYPIAMGLGLIVALSALKGVELVLACMIIYLPFSKIFVVPIAPGVNGTNMLVLLGLFAALLQASTLRLKLNDWPPGTALVAIFGVVTAFSVVTISLLPGGRTYFLYNEVLSYKAWVDQFIFYFIVLMCVRDVESAKRCVVYMLIGSVLVVLYSVPEMLEKMGRSTIEKSRIDGPHLQSNNFGGFVAYTLLPLVAVFFIYIKDLRAWLLTPYFLLAAKVLITTFSRGAYVAMVVGGFLAGWYKGRGFLAFWMTVVMCLVLVFPSVIPDSIMARMNSLTNPNADSSIPEEEKLDKSSETRLIMWRAGAQMILESPVLGKGFKGFPYLKDDYTEIPVEESDPHSMYLYIGSQMGLPALALFLLILAYSFNLGRLHANNKHDRFIRAIGIGGAAATACYAVVCVFGSRAVTLNFTAYFWAYLVVMQVLKQKQTAAEAALTSVAARTNAFAVSGNGTRGVRREKSEEPGADPDPTMAKTKKANRAGRRAGKRGAAAFQAASSAVTPEQPEPIEPTEPTEESSSNEQPDESSDFVSDRLRRKLQRKRGKRSL